jgi:hypothetical protein
MSGETHLQTSPAAQTQSDGTDAMADWERRVGQRRDAHTGPGVTLPPPSHVTAEPGAGHIRLGWAPVPGAAGYLIERAAPSTDRDAGPPEILRHGGSDVAAVVAPPFADTGVSDGVTYQYRIAAVAGAELPAGTWPRPALPPLPRARSTSAWIRPPSRGNWIACGRWSAPSGYPSCA